MKTNVWIESLGDWCLPRCCYFFINPQDGRKYCIHIKLGWGGSWSSELVRCSDGWKEDGAEEWDLLWDDDAYSYIETSRKYSAPEYRELEDELVEIVQALFPHAWLPNALIAQSRLAVA